MSMSMNEARTHLRAHHAWFRANLFRLDTAAWDAAHGTSARETVNIVRTCALLREELMKHIKYAEGFVHPFAGRPQAQKIVAEHLANQRVIERAIEAARAHARASLVDEVASIEVRVMAFFAVEREFVAASMPRVAYAP
jgi:hypothetical protein